MAIVPAGVPLWLRTVDFSHYGGHASKQNYLSRGAIDALTDVDAAQFARLTADAVAIARTTPFAVLTIRVNDEVAAAPTIEMVNMATGVQLTPYSGAFPPTGLPGASRSGNGDITVTFASSYSDAYGVSAAFAISHARASAIYKSVCRAVAAKVSATSVRVRVVDETSDAVISGDVDGDPANVLRVTVTVF